MNEPQLPWFNLSKHFTFGRGLKTMQIILEHLAFDLMKKKPSHSSLLVFFSFCFIVLKRNPNLVQNGVILDSGRF